MIEQPLRRGADAPLANFSSPVPLCADESCLHLGELDQAAGRYQLINIKLDKTGGLTQVTCLTLAAMFLHYECGFHRQCDDRLDRNKGPGSLSTVLRTE